MDKLGRRTLQFFPRRSFPRRHPSSRFLAKYDVPLVDDARFIYYIFPVLRLRGGGNERISPGVGLVQENRS